MKLSLATRYLLLALAISVVCFSIFTITAYKNGHLGFDLFFAFSVVYFLGFIVFAFITKKNADKRFQAEEKLRFWAAVATNIQDPIFTTDTNYIITSWNEGAENLLGFTEEEAVGKAVGDLLKVTYPIVSRNEAVAYFKQHNQCKGEIIYHTKLGTPLNMLASVAKLKDPAGKITGCVSVAKDITERKKFENALLEFNTQLENKVVARTSELMLEKSLSENIINSLPGVFYLADLNGKLLLTNKNFETISGYKAEEITNMRVREFVAMDDQQSVLMQKDLAIKTGTSEVDADFLTKHKQKSPYHFTSILSKYKGQPCLLGVGIDISERKKTEHALAESEKKYRLLFQNNPLPMWMLETPSLKIIDVNGAAVVHYGYTRTEFLTMNARDLRPKEDEAMWEKQISRTVRQGTYHAGKWRHKKKNGEVIIASIVTHDVEFDTGNMRIVLANDITERECAEEELIRSEERLARAQAVAKVGSWQTDLKTLNVIWSRETYRIFELDPEKFEPTHNSFLGFIHPDDRSTVDDAFKGSAQHSGLNRIEHRITGANGTLKYVEERWEIFRDGTGEPVTAIGTCQDITERITAVEKIKQSEENYRFLFNNNPAVIFIWDLETLKIIEVNQAAEAVYGYTHPGVSEHDLA